MKSRLMTTGLLAALLIVATIGLLPQADAAPNESRTSNSVIVNYAPQTLALTGTQTLTPALSMYLLAPPTAVTYTLSVSNAVAGDLIILVGTVTTSTVLVDPGATGTGGNRTLGNGDVWSGYFNGTIWVEESFIDNS